MTQKAFNTVPKQSCNQSGESRNTSCFFNGCKNNIVKIRITSGKNETIKSQVSNSLSTLQDVLESLSSSNSQLKQSLRIQSMSKSLYIFLTLVNFFASHGSSFSQPFDTTSAGSGSVAPPASIGRTTAFTYLEVVSCPERMVDIKVNIICKKMQNASKRPHFGAMNLLYNEVKTV